MTSRKVAPREFEACAIVVGKYRVSLMHDNPAREAVYRVQNVDCPSEKIDYARLPAYVTHLGWGLVEGYNAATSGR